MATGTVKVFSPARGSGWIRPDAGGNLMFVHKSGIVRTVADRAASLQSGQKVEYQVGQRAKGSAALNVTVVSEA